MLRSFRPEFIEEYKKTGDDSPPLMPETLAQLIRELPQNDEVVELFKSFSDPVRCPRVGEIKIRLDSSLQ